MEKRKNRKFKMPDAFVIMFWILLLAAILTYLLPAGTYQYVDGTSMIDPDSFQFIENTPVSLWQVIASISTGLENSASIIFMIMLMGGYFNVLLETQAIDKFITQLIERSGKHSVVVLFCVCLFMALMGASGVVVNAVVAFVPLGLVLAKRMKKDSLVALGMIFVSTYCGFSTSPMSAATVQYAQQLADVPLLSGFGFRTVVFVSLFIVTVIYIQRYAKRCNKTDILDETLVSVERSFTVRHIVVLLTLVVGIVVYIWGSIFHGWTMEYLEGIMLIVSFVSAAAVGMGTEKYISAFMNGVKKMCYSAILVGCAAGVSVILNEGNILHTIVYEMSRLLLCLPKWMVGPAMFYFNIIFNFFVSSGSGQARIVMPVMAPLADVVGISRQMAICAYQYGDGTSNLIFPTNGTMMACIAIANVRFDKWMKWMFPLFVIWTVILSVWMVVGVTLGI